MRIPMLTIYEFRAGALKPQTGKPKITEEAVWLDLLNPTQEEEREVETALKLGVPTLEEQREIEVSSRLYQENGAQFMTATLILHSEQAEIKTTPVTFILAGRRLVTVRYAEPRAFAIFAERCNRSEPDPSNGAAILTGLLETIIDRLADFIERVQTEVDTLSHTVFKVEGGSGTRLRRYDVVLRSIGREGEIASKSAESAHSLSRLLTFFAHAAKEREESKALQSRIRTAARDVHSLTDHVTFLSGKIIFLLDATLGMINIQQADIIKIFSVVAVVFLPPTLIASIYGMNFRNMPELDWWLGYPVAIGLMVLCAVLPYLYFKRRGWL
ncbi:MAG: magnesium transporter CorA family protein [Methyloceanibacter sp.]